MRQLPNVAGASVDPSMWVGLCTRVCKASAFQPKEDKVKAVGPIRKVLPSHGERRALPTN